MLPLLFLTFRSADRSSVCPVVLLYQILSSSGDSVSVAIHISLGVGIRYNY